MSDQRGPKPLYKSEEARSRMLGAYEEALRHWPAGPGGSALERIRLSTAAGDTTVFSFGREKGASRPLLLLHGTGSNSILWLADAERLGEGRRVFAVDIPGEPGLSAETRLDWQGDAYARWLGEVIAALGLGEFDLLGLSIGAWIAASFAIYGPPGAEQGRRSLRSLILLCPSGIGRTKPSFLFKAMLQMPRGERGLEAIARSLYGDLEPPEGAIRAGMEFASATNARMETPRIFSDGELAGIGARLCLIVGEKDVMLRSKETAGRLGRLQPGAEIHLLPEAGHALMGQAELVLEFLDRDQ